MKNICKFLGLSVVASVGSIVAGGDTDRSKIEYNIPMWHALLIAKAVDVDFNDPDRVWGFQHRLNTNPARVPFQECLKLELKRRNKPDSTETAEKVYYFDNCSDAGYRYPEIKDDVLLKLVQLQSKQ